MTNLINEKTDIKDEEEGTMQEKIKKNIQDDEQLEQARKTARKLQKEIEAEQIKKKTVRYAPNVEEIYEEDEEDDEDDEEVEHDEDLLKEARKTAREKQIKMEAEQIKKKMKGDNIVNKYLNQ
jgi:hypothetical protein